MKYFTKLAKDEVPSREELKEQHVKLLRDMGVQSLPNTAVASLIFPSAVPLVLMSHWIAGMEGNKEPDEIRYPFDKLYNKYERASGRRKSQYAKKLVAYKKRHDRSSVLNDKWNESFRKANMIP